MTDNFPVLTDHTKIAACDVRQVVPTLIAAAGDRVRSRFLEFFAARIRNLHARRAYGHAVVEFLAWCHDNQCFLHRGHQDRTTQSEVRSGFRTAAAIASGELTVPNT